MDIIKIEVPQLSELLSKLNLLFHKLEGIDERFVLILKNGEKLMALIDDLAAAVKDVKTATDEMAVRVDKIIADLQANPGNPAAVQAAIDALKAESAQLRAFHATTPLPPPPTP